MQVSKYYSTSTTQSNVNYIYVSRQSDVQAALSAVLKVSKYLLQKSSLLLTQMQTLLTCMSQYMIIIIELPSGTNKLFELEG